MVLILVAFERQMGAKWDQSGAQNGQNGSQEHQGWFGKVTRRNGRVFYTLTRWVGGLNIVNIISHRSQQKQ